MKSKYSTSIVYAVLMPVLLVVDAIKSHSPKYKRWALTLFFGVYGSTIIMHKSNDGYRHLQNVYEHYVGLPFERFLYELVDILTFQVVEGAPSDVYNHVLSYLVGGVFGLPELYFVFVALIYGYFFSGVMIIVFRHFREAPKNLFFWAFVVLFILIKSIEGVNTVRTWTGMWVLVYASLRYYETKNWKYILLMFAPPFIHFGYFLMALPVYAFLIIGNKKRIFALAFVLSSFTSIVNPAQVANTLEQTELGEDKVQAYYQEEQGGDAGAVVNRTMSGGDRWYRAMHMAGIQIWALNVLVYTLLITGLYFKRMTLFQSRIFSIGLLMLTLSNVSWFLYAVSKRSALIGMVFIFAAFVMMLQSPETNRIFIKPSRLLKSGMALSLLLFVPYFVYNLSTLLDFPSLFLFFTPFVPWFDASLNLSLKEFLRFFVL